MLTRHCNVQFTVFNFAIFFSVTRTLVSYLKVRNIHTYIRRVLVLNFENSTFGVITGCLGRVSIFLVIVGRVKNLAGRIGSGEEKMDPEQVWIRRTFASRETTE